MFSGLKRNIEEQRDSDANTQLAVDHCDESCRLLTSWSEPGAEQGTSRIRLMFLRVCKPTPS